MPLLKVYFAQKRKHLEHRRLQEAEKEAEKRDTKLLLAVVGFPSECFFTFSILIFTIFLVLKLDGVCYS